MEEDQRPEEQKAVSMAHPLDENYCYSVMTLALRWGISRESVRRLMLREPDVLIFTSEPKPGKRIYRRFSIPGAVAKRVERRVMNVRQVA